MNPAAPALYLASIAGALALLLMMPRRGFNPRALGALLGAATLGGLWFYLARALPAELFDVRQAYYYIFSGLAIASAVRVITHTRPVYAALWFVMAVLASSGLLLILGAEFMAFAMIIIYGGAILVTYVFVIMLAAQSAEGDADATREVEYDAVAREPLAAVVVGFVLLAVLLNIAFTPPAPNPAAAIEADEVMIATVLTDRPAVEITEGYEGPLPEHLAAGNVLTNTERVGLDLFNSHPLGLELAGVILLISLIGAVVIARQRVPEPTGDRRVYPPQGAGGATAYPTQEAGPGSPESVESANEGSMHV